uniref:NmrA-like domain-containing protein n=1 Tax=Hildenbrandia rubra TaxID=31481 RepID=A0A1C9CG35_9FLOR|nr:hypothetical protein Hrub_090 [Hildenbrandia rubra]AOM67334.1 hypothetical protein Hrub_090 [Hildenbrandia rubra]
MSLLIVGSTGTLGRQIVRKALDEGFQVKCLVRNIRKAVFLKEWGAELVYADLSIPETIPLTLNGVTAIIDASTTRAPNRYSAKEVDLYGKIALIKAAEIAQVERFICFSILNADKYPSVPLMTFKSRTEAILKSSNLNYTIFTLHGFFQGLISQYAIPILDEKSVWITKEATKVAYIDTQDVASFVIRSLSMPYLENLKLPLVGICSWTTLDIIQLCEKLSGKKSKVAMVPITLLKVLRKLTSLSLWSWNISERLAFTETLINNLTPSICMKYIYNIFQLHSDDNSSLDNYLNEYFSRILKKLQELNTLNNPNEVSF